MQIWMNQDRTCERDGVLSVDRYADLDKRFVPSEPVFWTAKFSWQSSTVRSRVSERPVQDSSTGRYCRAVESDEFRFRRSGAASWLNGKETIGEIWWLHCISDDIINYWDYLVGLFLDLEPMQRLERSNDLQDSLSNVLAITYSETIISLVSLPFRRLENIHS